MPYPRNEGFEENLTQKKSVLEQSKTYDKHDKKKLNFHFYDFVIYHFIKRKPAYLGNEARKRKMSSNKSCLGLLKR